MFIKSKYLKEHEQQTWHDKTHDYKWINLYFMKSDVVLFRFEHLCVRNIIL